jgi:hypothetical protein
MIPYEEIIERYIDLLADIVGDKEYFPRGSCISVSAHLAPLIRATTGEQVNVVVGYFKDSVHTWIEISTEDKLYIDPTVCQFKPPEGDDPYLTYFAWHEDQAKLYRSSFVLTRDQECDLRDHSEAQGFGLSARDGRYLLQQARRDEPPRH